MHTAAFAALGIADEWSYEAIDLAPEGFAAGIAELRGRGFVGVNVTVPHKEAAFRIADRRSDAVDRDRRRQHAQLRRRGDRSPTTPTPSGLIAALPDGFDPAGARALVLGAGGSARAVGLGARPGRRGGDGRQPDRRRRRSALAAELGVEASRSRRRRRAISTSRAFDLLVNATSVGLASGGCGAPPPGADLKALRLRADQLVDPLVVVDLVYGSEPTELAATCMSGGATFVDGLEILVQPGRGVVPDLDRAGATDGDHAKRSPRAANAMSDPRDRPDYLRAVPDDRRRLGGARPAARAGAARPG